MDSLNGNSNWTTGEKTFLYNKDWDLSENSANKKSKSGIGTNTITKMPNGNIIHSGWDVSDDGSGTKEFKETYLSLEDFFLEKDPITST